MPNAPRLLTDDERREYEDENAPNVDVFQRSIAESVLRLEEILAGASNADFAQCVGDVVQDIAEYERVQFELYGPRLMQPQSHIDRLIEDLLDEPSLAAVVEMVGRAKAIEPKHSAEYRRWTRMRESPLVLPDEVRLACEEIEDAFDRCMQRVPAERFQHVALGPAAEAWIMAHAQARIRDPEFELDVVANSAELATAEPFDAEAFADSLRTVPLHVVRGRFVIVLGNSPEAERINDALGRDDAQQALLDQFRSDRQAADAWDWMYNDTDGMPSPQPFSAYSQLLERVTETTLFGKIATAAGEPAKQPRGITDIGDAGGRF